MDQENPGGDAGDRDGESASGPARRWRAAFPLFDRLVELPSVERARELDELARHEPSLHARVVTLLGAAAAADAAGLLDDTTRPRQPASEELRPGLQWGAYRLERCIGAGGMGEVWLARRTDGLYEGQVAIKTLHDGLARPTLKDRFARETRLLARLSHPCIARLLDAGVAEDGRVYMVLEYIDGERIDRWADRQHLDLRARLRLVLDVCAAVEHAHRHLIVHRDIKPSNILVGADGQARLLDFGIAKLLEDDRDGDTELTRLGGRPLTPEYAAPEQLLGEPVTTATDVYSLGVLLYELVVGQRPYATQGQTPAQAGLAAVTAEPTAPSQAVLRGTHVDGTVLGCRRLANRRQFFRLLRGDLDNLIGKALKKHPRERYDSVQALAQDLRAFLADQPVAARADRLSYRAAKFVRRNRLATAFATMLAASLVIGTAGIVIQARRAIEAGQAEHRERQRAEARETEMAAVVEFQRALLSRVDIEQFGLGWMDRMQQALTETQARQPAPDARAAQQTLVQFDRLRSLSQPSEIARSTLGDYLLGPAARALDGRFADQPGTAAALRESLGAAFRGLGRYADARDHYRLAAERRATADGPQARTTLEARLALAATEERAGDLAAGLATARQALADARRVYGPDDPLTRQATVTVATILFESDSLAEGIALLEPVFAAQTASLGTDHPETLATAHQLGRFRGRSGDFEAAQALLQSAYEGRRRQLGPDADATLDSLQELTTNESYLEWMQPQREHAEQLYRTRLRLLGERHPQTLAAGSRYAGVLVAFGELATAYPMRCQALDDVRRAVGRETLQASVAANNCALARADLGDAAGALELIREVVALRTRLLGPDNTRTLYAQSNLGRILTALDPAAAVTSLRRTLADQRRVFGIEELVTLETWRLLGSALLQAGRHREALAEFEALAPVAQKHLEPASELTLYRLRDHAAVLLALRQYPQALALQEPALATAQAELPPKSPLTLTLRRDLAATLGALGRQAEARAHAEAALAGLSAELPESAPEVVRAAAVLRALDRGRGPPSEGVELRLQPGA